MWIICFYSKDLYSPSIHQLWLPHLIILRPWKQHGVWTIQRFSLFLYYYFLQMLYFIQIFYTLGRFHSHGRHLCKFVGTKESVCIRKEFNSNRIGLGHQHGCHFIVLRHQYGSHDIMWKHSILLIWLLADMLTDMVNMLTNVNQYWPRFGQDINWMLAGISTEGCLQCTRHKKFMIKCIVCL